METQDSSVGLRREELYELVWATPVQRLGSELGICDVALRGSTSKGKLPDLISAPSNASRRNDVPETPPRISGLVNTAESDDYRFHGTRSFRSILERRTSVVLFRQASE